MNHFADPGLPALGGFAPRESPPRLADRVYAPLRWLVQGLSLGGKFAVVALILALPLVWLLISRVRDLSTQVDGLHVEVAASDQLRMAQTLNDQLSRQLPTLVQYVRGDPAAAKALAQINARARAVLTELDRRTAEGGAEPGPVEGHQDRPRGRPCHADGRQG